MASGKVIHNLDGGLGPRQRVLRGGSGYVFSVASLHPSPHRGRGGGGEGVAPLDPTPGLRPPSPARGEGTTLNTYGSGDPPREGVVYARNLKTL
jgi:hypothetical protein